MDDAAAAIAEAFSKQVDWCQRLGAPFMAALLGWLRDDWLRGGPTHALVPVWSGGPPATDLLPLRLAGGLHALVLAGRQPELAAHYPPATFDAAAIGPVLARVLVEEAPALRTFLASAPQTNEVMRSAALLGGYAAVAAATGLPLALREIGASAGLNLLWDRFAYRLGAQRWGDGSSPVQLESEWRGTPPTLPAHIAVADRLGNDLAPIDPTDAAAALRLRAYVWPDQPARAARLGGALELARTGPARVEGGDAADWVECVFATPQHGRATTLVHSIVWQYLRPDTRERITVAMEAAGALATAQAPIAWLRVEFFGGDGPAELRLRLWPGGHERTLAHTHPHGDWVEWLA